MNRYHIRLLWVVIITTFLVDGLLGAGQKPAWPPRLYGFCVELPAVPNPSISGQAKLLKELGFDGVGYALWLGETMDNNLRVLDEVGQQLYLVYMTVNLNAEKPAFDPRVPEALAKLKGRPVTVSVLFRGFPPGDPRGMEPAVKILRALGDLAAKSDLKISIYHQN